MDTIRIRSCCCLSLYTAGIIVASVVAILAVVSIILIPVLLVSLFVLISNILWLYGIYVKNHKFLVPSLVMNIILCLWSLVLPLMSMGYEILFYRHWITLFSIVSWCVVALSTYAWILKYSVYKYMVEATQGNNINGKTVEVC